MPDRIPRSYDEIVRKSADRVIAVVEQVPGVKTVIDQLTIW